MAEYIVTAPQPITGDIAGVTFHKGRATADSESDRRALAYFRRHGYSVETAAEPEPTPSRTHKTTDKGAAS